MKLRIEVRNLDKRDAPRTLEFAEGPVHAGRSSAGHIVLDEQPISRLQLVFEEIHGAPQLSLTDVRRFASGVLVLVYTPKA